MRSSWFPVVAGASRCPSMNGSEPWREASSPGSLSTRSKWRVRCDPRRSRTGSALARLPRRSPTPRACRSNASAGSRARCWPSVSSGRSEAQRATVRSQSGPGPRLGEIVTERLADVGVSADEADWDSRKRQDGNWQVQLAYTVAGRMYVAEWVYDPRSRHVVPDDDEAMRLCLSEEEWPEPRQPVRHATTATVTPIGSRSAPAAAQQPDRTHSDRTAGNGVLHPSMQASAGVAAGAALGRPARLTGQTGEPVHPSVGRSASAAAGRGARAWVRRARRRSGCWRGS